MATAFWIADRHSYLEEAANSAGSLSRHNPGVRRVLFTPNPQQSRKAAFDEVRALPARESEFWFVDATRYMKLAVGSLEDTHLLYLDTDTWVCDDLSDIFKMLNMFDFLGAHAPGRRTAPGADHVPPAFPEINVGVNGIKRSAFMFRLLDDWHRRMVSNPQNNDQPALRALLYEQAGGVRLGVLPPEYNCRWGFGGFARYAVKVLHGRPEGHMTYQDVADRINAGKDMRGWQRGTLP